MVLALEGLAALAAAEGDCPRATSLAAAASAWRTEQRVAPSRAEAARLRAALAPAHAAAGTPGVGTEAADPPMCVERAAAYDLGEPEGAPA